MKAITIFSLDDCANTLSKLAEKHPESNDQISDVFNTIVFIAADARVKLDKKVKRLKAKRHRIAPND